MALREYDMWCRQQNPRRREEPTTTIQVEVPDKCIFDLEDALKEAGMKLGSGTTLRSLASHFAQHLGVPQTSRRLPFEHTPYLWLSEVEKGEESVVISSALDDGLLEYIK